MYVDKFRKDAVTGDLLLDFFGKDDAETHTRLMIRYGVTDALHRAKIIRSVAELGRR